MRSIAPTVAERAPTRTQTRTCGHCEGRRVLYMGAPDALGTQEVPCDHCQGRGRLPVRAEATR